MLKCNIYRVQSTMLEQRNILCVVLRFNLKYCTLCNDLMKQNKWLEFIPSCCALELKCCVVLCILYWKSTAAPAVGSSTLVLEQCQHTSVGRAALAAAALLVGER